MLAHDFGPALTRTSHRDKKKKDEEKAGSESKEEEEVSTEDWGNQLRAWSVASLSYHKQKR